MSENKIPTAEELILERVGTRSKWVEELMIEFAKLHCEAQLKAIQESVETTLWQNNEDLELISGRADYIVNRIPIKDAIINAYDLNQIK